MGMVANSIGLVAVSEDGKYIDLEIEIDYEESAKIDAGSSYFGTISTKEDLLKKVKAFPFLYHGKRKTFSSMLSMEYRNHDPRDIDDFIQKNGISAVIIYTYTEVERNITCRECSWLAYKLGSDHATGGTDWLPYDLQAKDWITRPTKAEYISELIPVILDDSSAVRIEDNRVFLRENSAAERLEKKLKEYRTIQIKDREILLQITEEDVIRVDANGINTFVDISEAKQDFARVWNHVIETGGLYDYQDWERKRSRYFDTHGGWDAVKNALTPEQKASVPFQYANDPSECCALLDVIKFTFEDSLIKLAEKADKFMAYCGKLPLEAARLKDGELKVGGYYPDIQFDILLFPREDMVFSGRVVSENTIKMSLYGEWRAKPKKLYGDFEVDADKCLTNYFGNAEEPILPDWIEKIDTYVFCGRHDLKTIEIPKGVKALGHHVFTSCTNLVSVSFSSGVEEIGDHTFYGCKSLTTVHLPSTLQKICRAVFRECESLTSIEIPEGVKAIQSGGPKTGAFYECKNLKSVVFPSTLELIGEYAFCGCENLTTIEIPEGVTELAGFAFSGCKSLASVRLPSTLEKIRKNAFIGLESLTSIEIPEGVTEIEKGGQKSGAFAGCKNLKSVQLPSTLEKIGDYAFCGCESLTSIEIPDTVTGIGKNTFLGCEHLQIIAPEGSYAAKFGAKNNIPVILKAKRAEKAFETIISNSEAEIINAVAVMPLPCGDEMPELTIAGSYNSNCADDCDVDSKKRLTQCRSKEKDLVLPEGIEIIGKSAFVDLEITSIVLPEGVKEIETRAFLRCNNLKSVHLPSTLKKIGDYAFCGCVHLLSIEIPETVTELGKKIFLGCDNLQIIAPEGSCVAQYAKENNIPCKCSEVFAVADPLEEQHRAEEEVHRQQEEAARAAAEAERIRREEETRGLEEQRQAEEARRQQEEAARAAAEAERKQKEEARRRWEEASAMRRKQEEEAAAEAEQKRKEEEAARAAAEAERIRKEEEQRQKLEAEKARYRELLAQIAEQKQIINENKAWFGARAKARKAAKHQLAVLSEQLNREFPNGEPKG